MKEVEIKNKFFHLFEGVYSTKKFAVPIAPEENSHMDIPKSGYQENWKPITFKKLKEDGPIPDLVSTDICGRIFSKKLKAIIEQNTTADDNEIQWLPMLIEDEETGNKIEYYYLHFPIVCDTIDLEKADIDPIIGTPSRRILIYDKVQNRSIFNCLGGNSFIYVSKKLKEEMFRSGSTGIYVEEAIAIQILDEKKAS